MINANRTAKALSKFNAKPIKTTVAPADYLGYALAKLRRIFDKTQH